MRVLLVEDNPLEISMDLLVEVLKEKGYHVDTALSAEEGWKMVQSAVEPYDIVFTDWRMPGMTGLELAHRIHDVYPRIAISIITGYGPEFDEDFKRHPLPISYLIKPVGISQILARIESARILHAPMIITEGKTDWKHLKHALAKLQANGQFPDLKITFFEFGSEVQAGSGTVQVDCERRAKTPNDRKYIYLFDRDEPNIIKQVTKQGDPKSWGHHVYSFVLPVPAHRTETPDICIEFYYTDEEITRKDEEGRRLYFSYEFTRRHEIDGLIWWDDRRKNMGIVDNHVYHESDLERKTNIALSKAKFAEYILDGHPNFDDFDVTEFAKIFTVIEQILAKQD